jgi:hypothetical protein
MSSSAASIAVFARSPVPGQAKTRLIPLLGADGAARLQRQLMRQALAKASAVAGPAAARVSLWIAGDVAHPSVQDCARDFGVDVHAQAGADLGARMSNAFSVLRGRCVLIGTDCPALTPDDLRTALAALAGADVVVQPADDGGYVLIGLRAPQPRLFEAIDWGTASVMASTRQRIRELDLAVHELPMRPDLDTPADYAHALAAGWITA